MDIVFIIGLIIWAMGLVIMVYGDMIGFLFMIVGILFIYLSPDQPEVPVSTPLERAVEMEYVKYSSKGELVYSGNMKYILTGNAQ
jgi:hypothetical protein